MLYCAVKTVIGNFSMLYCTVNVVIRNFPMLYCCIYYKNVKRDKKFLRSRFFVCSWGFVSSFLKYKKFTSWNRRVESSIYKNIRKFRYARVLNIPFLKYRKKSISWNIKHISHFFRVVFLEKNLRAGPESAGFYFQEYKKSFLLRKCKKFFDLRVRKFHFPKYTDIFQGELFRFFELGLKRSISQNIRSFLGFPFPEI